MVKTNQTFLLDTRMHGITENEVQQLITSLNTVRSNPVSTDFHLFLSLQHLYDRFNQFQIFLYKTCNGKKSSLSMSCTCLESDLIQDSALQPKQLYCERVMKTIENTHTHRRAASGTNLQMYDETFQTRHNIQYYQEIKRR